jgi:hypothetical protein
VDYTELLQLVRSSNESLEKIGTSLSALGDPDKVAAATALAPSATPASVVTQGVPDQGAGTPYVQRQILDMSTRMALRSELRKKSLPELHMLFQMQMAKRNSGIPFEMWAASGGHAGAIFDAFHMQAGMGGAADISPTVLNALDTGGAAALIRQDLEPFLYELYIRKFPAFERFVREPANGLTHTYNQITSFGAAKFMAELGTVTDDTVDLRPQDDEHRDRCDPARALAEEPVRGRRGRDGLQPDGSGASGWPSGDLEADAVPDLLGPVVQLGRIGLDRGRRRTTRTASTACGRSSTRPGRRTSTPSPAPPRTSSTRSTSPSRRSRRPGAACPRSSGRIRTTRSRSTAAGQERALHGAREPTSTSGSASSGTRSTPGRSAAAGSSRARDRELHGDRWSRRRRDMYILDESTISLPYLGSEGPTVLDIPIGISGQLTHLFIIFGMWGLAVKALPFSNKLRVRQS